MRNAIVSMCLVCVGCARTPEPWESAPKVVELHRLDDQYRQEWLAAGNTEKHEPGSLSYLLDHENAKTKARLIEMARARSGRPAPDTGDAAWLGLWTDKNNHGLYDRKFDHLIRELAPDWFPGPK